MNDRFKFRAWHKPTKKLFDVHCFTETEVFENTLDGVGTSPTNPAKMEDCILLQCTGLKDNAGDLIYEGDIVDLLTEIDETAVIEWDEVTACFCVVSKSGGFTATFDNYRGDDLEIIGNIHENPEMLGGSEK